MFMCLKLTLIYIQKLNQMNEELRNDRARHAKDMDEKDSRIDRLEKELLAWEHSHSVLVGDANEISLKKGSSLPQFNKAGSPKLTHGQTSGDGNPLTGKVKSQTSKGDVDSEEAAQVDASPYDDSDPTDNSAELCAVKSVDEPDKTDSDQSGDDGQSGTTEETRTSLTKRIAQIEENNRRLLSRLKFLDSRLETKEDAIRRLNNRIEVWSSH